MQKADVIGLVFVSLCVGLILWLFVGPPDYRSRTDLPAAPVTVINDNLPAPLSRNHPSVVRDGNGWYWIEPGAIDSCLRCHPDRWNGAGGPVHTRKLHWAKDRKVQPENKE